MRIVHCPLAVGVGGLQLGSAVLDVQQRRSHALVSSQQLLLVLLAAFQLGYRRALHIAKGFNDRAGVNARHQALDTAYWVDVLQVVHLALLSSPLTSGPPEKTPRRTNQPPQR